MPEYVRVRDRQTGHHISITRARFDRDPSLWQELKQPATLPNGDLIPVKYKTSVSSEAAKKASPTAATSEKKEN